MEQEAEQQTEQATNNSRLAMALFGLSLLAIAALLVPTPFVGRPWNAAGNFTHAPLFALILLVPLLVLGRQFKETDTAKSIIVRTFIVALCVFLFGVIVELLQSVSGRSPSVHDIIANGWGIIAGLLFYAALVLWRYPNSTFSVIVLIGLAICAGVAIA